jgi:hypothetical protein
MMFDCKSFKCINVLKEAQSKGDLIRHKSIKPEREERKSKGEHTSFMVSLGSEPPTFDLI